MNASRVIQESLSARGIDATVVIADSSVKAQLESFHAVIFASPTWDDMYSEGQPLPEIKEYLESLTAKDLAGKKVAVLGLGDTSYEHFCGAVDVIESILKKLGVVPIVPSLRIDKYYFSPNGEEMVKNWADTFASILLSSGA